MFRDGSTVITNRKTIGIFSAETSEDLGITYFGFYSFDKITWGAVKYRNGKMILMPSTPKEWVENEIKIICKLKRL